MIKKLRKKFILIALGVVAAVILAIVVGIDVANYVNMTRDADEIIAGLETGDVRRPPDVFFPEDFVIESEKQGDFKGLPRETAFSARYFTVETDAEGNVRHYDLGSIAYVRSDDLAEFVAEADSDSGFVGDYRYKRTATADGYAYIFLDCEKEIEAVRDFILSSAIVTVVGLLIIAALIVLLSKKALRPVEESYEKQKRFITDAGHELKTPLTVISANAELLELEVGENEWIESIKGQVKKLGKLTKDLVFLSRMDEGSDNFPTAAFSLKNALEDVVDGLKEAALVAGRSFIVDAEDVTVTANEEMIRRAIGLILDNAVKYSESERIEVSLRKEGKYAVLEERNAASLEKGEHPELFERFYRPDTSRTAATGGHGIGLSVVRSIVEAHRGSATCTSDGGAVVFKIMLPAIA
ncbi:MAG: HAMP domain-containing histidine kinase [Clostridia bacterium]|nr:HAMP domain-containing histidine kinase [Clostridia bacterium]